MEAVQKDHWYFMVLLIILSLLEVSSAQQRETVTTVRLEEGMVLECLCPWDGNLSMVSWTKVPDKTPVAVYHPEYGVSLFELYRERIAFLKTTPMDGSITLSNITQEDVGLYHCSVQTFPKGPWTRDILVEDSDVTEEIDIHVTVPEPEVIEVDTELFAERTDNLTITCNHEHNGTVYQVVLEKLAHGHGQGGGGGGGVGIMAVCKVVDGGLVGEDYTLRGRVNCSDSLEVSLHLTDVVEEDRGLYRCHFSTDAGLQTTTVLLTVPSPGEFSLSPYLIYICVGGGVAGLVLLLSVTLLLVGWHRRKKKRREEYRVKLHPASRRPANPYENIPIYDNMRKGTKQRGESPVYANIQTKHQHNRSQR